VRSLFSAQFVQPDVHRCGAVTVKNAGVLRASENWAARVKTRSQLLALDVKHS
jgi:hypothetical protein